MKLAHKFKNFMYLRIFFFQYIQVFFSLNLNFLMSTLKIKIKIKKLWNRLDKEIVNRLISEPTSLSIY